MAGHNKWANIKHRKGAQDKRRGILFSKCSKAIMAAVRQNGPDPDMNLTLVYAIEKARAANMPRERIERAIQAASGGNQGESFETVLYEGYAPGGVAVLVEALTDNRHRTAPDVKLLFSNHGGNMGASGCVAHLFACKAVFRVATQNATEERLIELVANAGGEDVVLDGDDFELSGPPESFAALRNALLAAKLESTSAQISFVPLLKVELTDEAIAREVLALMEDFEDNYDVSSVTANFDIQGALAEKLAKE
ncbi:MAG: YebC/PmpR family DNA-binding transcriptional regulator [Planctomycetes bacterium]|nr:YebC/PmpR family DNA-binding transcriptional regulator [Planctomycetota bacterium]